ncbi:MAG: hypothetical protein RQ756_06750, partial [Flavobacteriaceae bacterium]|nr:hypothetical protein [Flavobacteriaceae bacterium]
KANIALYKHLYPELSKLPERFSMQYLTCQAKAFNNLDFERLALEYLPLKFSRRHGDPSRPWNKFTINTRNEDGTKILDYEGNWRDIFQNWEALAHAFPQFAENMMFKFLNASTFDGYNPYRITKDGFDWEVIEAHDPWSYIGYWGDHQIIYLLKFLEFIELHHPGRLREYFHQNLFVYANVPYKIKPYQALLNNPKDTIVFDEDLDKKLKANKEKIGSDAYLLTGKDGGLSRANFMEKVLCTMLAKVSNFVPEAGIWMNTQRPEWNDANNALVGNGTSMVTLCYLRRFLKFFSEILAKHEGENFLVADELTRFFYEIKQSLEQHQSLLSQGFNNQNRKLVLNLLGKAASAYREQIYTKGFSGNKTELSMVDFSDFTQLMLAYADQSITANLRSDELYHAYNLISIEEDAIEINYLDEMLEGQVAVLSSGLLDATQSLKLLNALKKSALFRHDQYSYILYPNKDLPKFLEKNTIPKSLMASSKLLQRLVEADDKSLVVKDVNGDVHFNGSFTNAQDVEQQLEALLDSEYKEFVKTDKPTVLNIFEQVFNHKAFTGRSGTFFGYEGLGSIYWHMVSKLQLAVQEVCIKAVKTKTDDVTFGKLLEHYYEINEGIGVHKSPELYGAFPTDPYSHTPETKGVQQPGMTGQVKEDILSRIGELGVFVKDKSLVFNPVLLRKNEFLNTAKSFNYISVTQESKTLVVYEKALAFTYAQVPIIYRLSKAPKIKVTKTDASIEEFDGLVLNKALSATVFERSAEIESIEVFVPESICK